MISLSDSFTLVMASPFWVTMSTCQQKGRRGAAGCWFAFGRLPQHGTQGSGLHHPCFLGMLLNAPTWTGSSAATSASSLGSALLPPPLASLGLNKLDG
jgi:hypothetical protein